MNKFKIVTKIFKENNTLSLKSKLYITREYLQNLKFLKNNSDNIHKYYQYKLNIEKNKKEAEPLPKSNLANMKNEISEIKKRIRDKKIEKIKNKLISLFNILNPRQLLELKNTQNNVQLFFAFISKHIGNYKRSIQELVEGQREVTQNQNFTFEDGESVKEKTDRFDKKVKEIFHINKKY
jgi:hypothetical protein